MNGDRGPHRSLPPFSKQLTNSSFSDGGRSRDYYSSRGDRDERRRDRRRSRSPGHRSRRDYEVDTYSSSRDYREREREERYSGRDRHREERGWDRDRGSRRDRRDDDERPSRRDRDLFDDRGGRNRRDRDRNDDAGGRGGRRRSATPPPKKREPTPDLTNVVSVLERKRRMTQWDIKPPGYENVTAEQAKLSGMFPLPGAPRQQPMDPSRLQAFMNQPAGSANASALKASNARQSKRLFVYNFPSHVNDEAVQDFFNLQLNHLNVISSPDPCTSAQISKDRTFALLEFKTPEDATTALALDGISMEADSATNGSSNGAASGLVIRRPKDYIVPAQAEEEEHQEGVISNKVKDSPQKIMVTNLPTALMEEQAHELLGSFGELKAFAMVKDSGTDQSRGIAFCEYLDPAATDIAVEGLNNMQISDQYIKVQKACVGLQQASGLEMGVSAMSMLAGTSSGDVEQGRVLMLLNMVTAEELMDKDEYDEICEDVKEECEKYGQVVDLKIPRPLHGKEEKGVGKIYIKYDTPESAQKALRALAGRKFADRTVVVTFFSEVRFSRDSLTRNLLT
ncbi:splicing factor u2af large subunit [Phyllosticta paracitricarpa]